MTSEVIDRAGRRLQAPSRGSAPGADNSGKGFIMTNPTSVTDQTTVDDFTSLADRYVAMWNAADPAVRRTLIGELCAADVRYTDPLADVTGRNQIDGLIAAVQQQFPGFTFALNSRVDAHHAQARFGWDLGPAGASAPVAGFDVITVDDAGQVTTVLGFLDRVPNA
jgi:hypothetical protein